MRGKPTTIDEYLTAVDAEKRAALQHLRQTILSIVPDAEECISYGIPAFRKGKVFAGFAAAKDHLSYYPFSGRVTEQLKDELTSYKQTPGSIHFSTDAPLPEGLLRKLIESRMSEDRF
jgi:uncharacterized protein YdhG (YjbR/CyaY superfamily)